MKQWLAALLLCSAPACAAAQTDPDQAIGFDVFASSDADHSNALKLGLSYDFTYTDAEHYQGVRLETFIFSSKGATATTQERGTYAFAGAGERWKWNGTLGTDGRSVLANGSLYTDEDYRQEYFFSRDLVETPIGVRSGNYFTYAGASFDIPLDDANSVTALGGLQKFDSGNWRLHLRGRYVYAVEPDWGLSLQMRTRYFWNSQPHESDYFSPRWYFEAIPTIQLRRFYHRWQYVAAFGWGARDDPDSQWHSARLANVSVTSPKFGQDWSLKAEFTYSNTPLSAGFTYDYEQVTLSLLKRL